jgi:hypothetical protein
MYEFIQEVEYSVGLGACDRLDFDPLGELVEYSVGLGACDRLDFDPA